MDSSKTLTIDRPIALTSRLTGKTTEGLPVDQFPNRFLNHTIDEIVAGQGGGRLWCDQISRPSRPTKKRRHDDRRKKGTEKF